MSFEIIDGETPIDPSHLINKELARQGNRDALNKAEFENITLATVKYLSSKSHNPTQFSIAFIQRVHKDMFCDVWTWAGKYRKTVTNIGVKPTNIETDLYEMVDNLHKYWCDLPIIEQSVYLHHRAVFIHPFENGNGRWSRMIANIWLSMNSHPIVNWDEGRLRGDFRQNYLTAVRSGDEGNFDQLLEMHKRLST